MKRILFAILLATATQWAGAQQIVNFAMASHPVMAEQIERTPQATVVRMRLSNQIAGGYFCLSKAVSAICAKAGYTGSYLRAEGMPTCPDVHTFSQAGESLPFALYFKPFPANLTYIDIEEKCDDNCLIIQGLVLDEKLNARINMAYNFFAEGKFDMAADLYLQLAQMPNYPFAVHHFNAIHAWAQGGNFIKAKQLYLSLKKTHFADTDYALQRLRTMPYFGKLL